MAVGSMLIFQGVSSTNPLSKKHSTAKFRKVLRLPAQKISEICVETGRPYICGGKEFGDRGSKWGRNSNEHGNQGGGFTDYSIFTLKLEDINDPI